MKITKFNGNEENVLSTISYLNFFLSRKGHHFIVFLTLTCPGTIRPLLNFVFQCNAMFVMIRRTAY